MEMCEVNILTLMQFWPCFCASLSSVVCGLLLVGSGFIRYHHENIDVSCLRIRNDNLTLRDPVPSREKLVREMKQTSERNPSNGTQQGKNSNWQKANQLPIYKHGHELGSPLNNPARS